MIPEAFITEWRQYAPWQEDQQVEQDLLIERAIVDIFANDFLRKNLAFRGGTALHKLYLQPAARYSEDIDLVQLYEGPVKDITRVIQQSLSWLGRSATDLTRQSMKIKFKVKAEFPPYPVIRLKIEINTREHFHIDPLQAINRQLNSAWYAQKASVTGYTLEELLATKLRALYQRRKGRDLFDLYYTHLYLNPDWQKVIRIFKHYMNTGLPTKRQYLANLEEKTRNAEFLGDTAGLLRAGIDYQPSTAHTWLTELIEQIYYE